MPCRIFTEKLKLMSSLFNIIATMGFLIQVTSRPLCVGPMLTQCSAEPKGRGHYSISMGGGWRFFLKELISGRLRVIINLHQEVFYINNLSATKTLPRRPGIWNGGPQSYAQRRRRP